MTTNKQALHFTHATCGGSPRAFRPGPRRLARLDSRGRHLSVKAEILRGWSDGGRRNDLRQLCLCSVRTQKTAESTHH